MPELGMCQPHFNPVSPGRAGWGHVHGAVQRRAVLCHAAPRHTPLCCAVVHCAVPCAMPRRAMLCHTVLCHAGPCSTVPCGAVLCHAVLPRGSTPLCASCPMHMPMNAAHREAAAAQRCDLCTDLLSGKHSQTAQLKHLTVFIKQLAANRLGSAEQVGVYTSA